MAPQSGPYHRPGPNRSDQNRSGQNRTGQRGPVFKEITWLQRWPRLVATGFILLILVEILIFVWVADHIGLGLTLLALIGSAAAGLWLIRRTGLDMVGRLRLALAQGQEPGHSLVDGACFVIAGMLLILPGFFTDFLALLLMLPGSRNWLIRRFAGAFGNTAGAGGTVITDVEFHEVREEPSDTAPADTEPATETGSAEAEILVPDRAPAANPRPDLRSDIIDVPAEEEGPADSAKTADEASSKPAKPGETDRHEKDAQDWPAKPRRPIIDIEES